MNTLLLSASDGLGRVSSETLPDSILLEITTQGFSPESKSLFPESDYTFLDVCSWQGIRCDVDAHVKEIFWQKMLG